MFILYKGRYPAIMCPATGKVVVVYAESARGWSNCMSDLRAINLDVKTLLAM